MYFLEFLVFVEGLFGEGRFGGSFGFCFFEISFVFNVMCKIFSKIVFGGEGEFLFLKRNLKVFVYREFLRFLF